MTEKPINQNHSQPDKETDDQDQYVQKLEEEITQLRNENEVLRQQIETLKDFN